MKWKWLRNYEIAFQSMADHPRMHLVNACVTSRHVTKMASYHSMRHNRKPHATRKSHGSYGHSKFYIARIGIFYTFPLVTLTLTRWPSYTKLTIPNVQIWTSYTSRLSNVVFWQTDRQTDTTEIMHMHHAASWVVKKHIFNATLHSDEMFSILEWYLDTRQRNLDYRRRVHWSARMRLPVINHSFRWLPFWDKQLVRTDDGRTDSPVAKDVLPLCYISRMPTISNALPLLTTESTKSANRKLSKLQP